MNEEIDKDLLIDLIRLYYIELSEYTYISIEDFLTIVDRIYVYLKKLGDKENE